MSEGDRGQDDSWWRFKFTWTGLLALLAIVGVIVVVTLPSHADYVVRSQASEAISLMSSAKTPLAEYFEDKRKWPSKLEEVVNHTGGKYTLSVAITKGMGGSGDIEMTATMRSESVDRHIAGTSILMTTSDGGKTWTCKPGSMPVKYLAASCRN